MPISSINETPTIVITIPGTCSKNGKALKSSTQRSKYSLISEVILNANVKLEIMIGNK
jgi:hypothetical protein